MVVLCSLSGLVLLLYVNRPAINFILYLLMMSSPISNYTYQISDMFNIGNIENRMTVLEMCLNVFVLEIHTYIITMNQPP